MKDGGFSAGNLWPLALVMAMSSVLCMLLLKRFGERVRRNRPDKMFWDKAVLFIEAPTA